MSIDAAPQAVWDVLVDVARWTEWDSGVVGVEGLLPLRVIAAVAELVSRNTSSAEVGTDAPPEPPLVDDQFVVFDEFQVPLPPRQ